MVYCVDVAPLYLVDIPRAMIDSHELWAAIESVKNGIVFDDRYQFKMKTFDSPQVIVFTNKLPNKDLLSGDRWVLHEIEGFELKDIDF